MDSSAAGLFQEAADELRQRATSVRLHEAADQLGANSVGQAVESQQQALNDLLGVKKILDESASTDAQSAARDLRRLVNDLQDLRTRQEDLLDESRELDPDNLNRDANAADRLQQSQGQLAREAAGVARRLRRTSAKQAGDSTDEAAENMEQASSNLDERNLTETQRQQEQAIENLQQAQRQAEERRRSIEDRLASDRHREAAMRLQAMAARQREIIEETVGLGRQYEAEHKWTRRLLRTLRSISAAQDSLKQEVDEVGEEWSNEDILSFALNSISDDMARAEQRLSQEKDAGQETVGLQKSAERRLVALYQALDQAALGEQQPTDPSAAERERSDSEPDEKIPAIAQLRLLKSLQEDLHTRTSEFDRRAKAGALSDDETRRAERLAAEQRDLVSLITRLVSQVTGAEAAPDENPNTERGRE